MKILVLYPGQQFSRDKSLGCSVLGGILKRENHKVSLFDSSRYDQTRVLHNTALREGKMVPLDWHKKSSYKLPMPDTHIDVIEAFNRKLDEFQPDVIFVTTTYLTFSIANKIISLSNARNSMVIYGGIHCITNPEHALNGNNVKYIHVGEGEISVPIILKKLEKNESIDSCDNIWVKKDNGEIIRNERTEMIKNLDDLPFYDWDIFLEDNYYERLFSGKLYRFGDYSISRGCVNKCNFCFYRTVLDAYGMEKNIVRRYSAERAIEELVYLKEKYNLTFIKFHDSDFLCAGSSYLDKFSTLYQKHVNLPTTISGCIEHASQKKSKFLVKMNCQSISIGLESGNEDIRRRLLKRHYANKLVVDNVKMLRENGIRVLAGNIIGLPGETRGNMMETMMLNKKAKVDYAHFNIFFPLPNLPLTRYAVEKGYLENDKNVDDYIYGMESPLKHLISQKQLRNIHRSMMLYVKLPYFMFPLIKYAEKYNIVFRLLRSIYFFKLHYLDISRFILRNRRHKVLNGLGDAAK